MNETNPPALLPPGRNKPGWKNNSGRGKATAAVQNSAAQTNHASRFPARPRSRAQERFRHRTLDPADRCATMHSQQAGLSSLPPPLLSPRRHERPS